MSWVGGEWEWERFGSTYVHIYVCVSEEMRGEGAEESYILLCIE